MPRPRAVEIHARGYKEEGTTLSRMPRACPVEFYVEAFGNELLSSE